MAELKCFDTNMATDEIRVAAALAATLSRAKARGKAPG